MTMLDSITNVPCSICAVWSVLWIVDSVKNEVNQLQLNLVLIQESCFSPKMYNTC